MRDLDLVCRWGGEEIVIALIGANKNNAQIIAEDIRQRIESSPLNLKNKKIHLTVSIGVIEFSREKNLEELISKADQAMYQAKKLGKNRVIVL